MKAIENFNELFSRFQQMPQKKRVAIVCPDDDSTIYVVERCLSEDLAQVILISSKQNDENCTIFAKKYENVTIFETDSVDEAAQLGVRLIRDGKADVLMKGLINTDNLLKAVLNKEYGLLPSGAVMSHVTAIETAQYNKLLFISDAAVIPRPTLQQFDAMVSYDTALAHKLGIDNPKVALIHFTEKVNSKFQHTLDYEDVKKYALAGRYGTVSIAGPMDVKTACDAKSAEVKGIITDVAGNADILIFPNLEAANVFYKTISCFGHAKMAGIIQGTIAPIVIPSRADSGESKLYSLALACLS